jgi:hypothetical protein
MSDDTKYQDRAVEWLKVMLYRLTIGDPDITDDVISHVMAALGVVCFSDDEEWLLINTASPETLERDAVADMVLGKFHMALEFATGEYPKEEL